MTRPISIAGVIACALILSPRIGDSAVELLYSSKDDWGGFLQVHQNSRVGELKASDLKLLKFAHKELLKEKQDALEASSKVLFFIPAIVLWSCIVP
jgi:hypothetical protein